ncbi:Hydrolase, alpha/beta fold family [Methylacidimicrobium sp. AP8]|uniref:alpha/beta fold hydrolase n=1 Tax=Methylacidimicrobium sp. AP8 TaxID=2730359 RepID=UPI0018C15922|nr:alpha/beta fold hydrolase [Methylacidimicrobium sp. AP8]CAB4244017.1 Hydrolase, alpha/beta fold family [Methylacidimicrobium sp. AP8]
MTFSSRDADLFFTVLGEGTPLVLLHPTPVDHRFWLPVARLLASEHRVILPDLRGHGRSQAGAGPITVEKLAEDAAALLDFLGIEKAFFGGCSIGGYALFAIWRRTPGRVLGLAFCCSRPQADDDAVRSRRQRNIGLIRAGQASAFVEEQLRTLFGPTARRRAPQAVEQAREMMAAASPEALVAVQEGLAARPDSIATARTIRVPCCVIAGGEDTASPPDAMRLLADEIRRGGGIVEYSEIPDAGHYAPFEQPERVAAILRRWLDGSSRIRAGA